MVGTVGDGCNAMIDKTVSVTKTIGNTTVAIGNAVTSTVGNTSSLIGNVTKKTGGYALNTSKYLLLKGLHPIGYVMNKGKKLILFGRKNRDDPNNTDFLNLENELNQLNELSELDMFDVNELYEFDEDDKLYEFGEFNEFGKDDTNNKDHYTEAHELTMIELDDICELFKKNQIDNDHVESNINNDNYALDDGINKTTNDSNSTIGGAIIYPKSFN